MDEGAEQLEEFETFRRRFASAPTRRQLGVTLSQDQALLVSRDDIALKPYFLAWRRQRGGEGAPAPTSNTEGAAGFLSVLVFLLALGVLIWALGAIDAHTESLATTCGLRRTLGTGESRPFCHYSTSTLRDGTWLVLVAVSVLAGGTLLASVVRWFRRLSAFGKVRGD